jgi:hypothetical protein
MRPLGNEEIVQKFKALTAGVVDSARQGAIIDRIAALDECVDLADLRSLLSDPVGSFFEP